MTPEATLFSLHAVCCILREVVPVHSLTSNLVMMMPKPCKFARQLRASTVLHLRHHRELCQLRRLLLHIWPSVERVMFDGRLFYHAAGALVSNMRDDSTVLLTCASSCEAE